jgi:hypothetical protein
MANGDDYIYIIISICHRVWVLDVLDTILVIDGTKVKQGINLLIYRRLHITSDVKVVVGCPRPPTILADWCLTLIERVRRHIKPSLSISHVTADIWVCT